MRYFRMSMILALMVTSVALLSCKSESNGDDLLTGRFVGTQRFGIGQVSSSFILVLRQSGQVVTGTVTPPFSSTPVDIANGQVSGTTLRFDRKEGSITYRYEATVRSGSPMQPTQISGGMNPLGCINPSSGEPCQSDSDGSFTATEQ